MGTGELIFWGYLVVGLIVMAVSWERGGGPAMQRAYQETPVHPLMFTVILLLCLTAGTIGWPWTLYEEIRYRA